MADLTIQISGDLKNYEDALESALDKTSSLNDKFKAMAEIGAVAFAAISAEQGLALKAFADNEKASNQLTQALQNQGIYSDELAQSYKEQAEELSRLTGLDDTSITKAQALLQGMIGQDKISTELTKSIIDLAAAKGMDLTSTTELVGKGIEGHVTALQRLGIHIDANLDKEGRTAAIIDVLNTKFGDQAEVMNQGLGGIAGLHAAFDNFQVELGERFAPRMEAIIKIATTFFQTLSDHEEVANLVFAIMGAGSVVAALTVGIGLAGSAWLKYTAAMEVAGLATEATSIATKGLVAATGLGLVLVLASEIYMHWSTWWPAMQDIFQIFVDNISLLAGGIGKILNGVFSIDVDQISEGLEDAKTAVSRGYDGVINIVKEKDKEEIDEITAQDTKKLALGNAQAAREKQLEDYKQATLKAEVALTKLTLDGASKDIIALKTAELDTLKKLQDEKNAGIRAALQEHLNQIKALEDLANSQSSSRQQSLNQDILAKNAQYQALDSSQKAQFLLTNQQSLINALETEKTIEEKYALTKIQQDVARRSQYLIEEKQFGTAYAAINEAMHSDIYSGSKNAFGDLAQLQGSKNAELKAIGKAAAIANVIIKTGESAMEIFAGFAAIPIVGVALGIAGAAAAVAFGAEQVASITSAAQGGLITGGIPGVDSVPAMLMQGELIVPSANFEEVVGAVRSSRSGGDGDVGNDEHYVPTRDRNIHVMVGFDGKTASQILTILQIEDSALGISPAGA